MACGPSKGSLALQAPPAPGSGSEVAVAPEDQANVVEDGADTVEGAASEHEAPATRVIDPQTFVSRIDALGPAGADSSAEAMALFVAAFTNPDPVVDEALRRQALERLLEYMDGNIPGESEEGHEPPPTDDTLCLMSGDCKPADVEPAERAMAQHYWSIGLTAVYEGEGTYGLHLDYTRLARQLAPALSEASAFYLEAKAWQTNMIDTSWDEIGFIGDPEDVAKGIVMWERLSTMSEVWAETGRDAAVAATHDYLGICLRWYDRPPCQLSADDRKSYARFMAEHPESMARPAVAHFVKAMKGRKWRAGENAHDKMQEASMKKIRAPQAR